MPCSALPWDAVYARHLGVIASLRSTATLEARSLPFVLEYPLQGLNGLAAGVAAGLAGRPPAAVVASPEASLDEIAGLPAAMAAGRCLTSTRRRPSRRSSSAASKSCTRATSWAAPKASSRRPARTATWASCSKTPKGIEFPADVDAGGTRLFNARVTNLTSNLDELRAAGVATFLVVQADLDEAERAAFVAGGLAALAPLAARERSTTGHLFRGVA